MRNGHSTTSPPFENGLTSDHLSALEHASVTRERLHFAVRSAEKSAVGHDKENVGAEKPMADAFALEALTAALHIACDAAVFSNRFEIDEQEPLSRIKALTEQLVEGVTSLPSKGLSKDEETDGKTATITIIGKVCERIRAAIR